MGDKLVAIENWYLSPCLPPNSLSFLTSCCQAFLNTHTMIVHTCRPEHHPLFAHTYV